jgi:hypothetical protein
MRDYFLKRLIKDQWNVKKLDSPTALVNKGGEVLSESYTENVTDDIIFARSYRTISLNPTPDMLYYEIVKLFSDDIDSGFKTFYLYKIYPAVFYCDDSPEHQWYWVIRYGRI